MHLFGGGGGAACMEAKSEFRVQGNYTTYHTTSVLLNKIFILFLHTHYSQDFIDIHPFAAMRYHIGRKM